MPDPLKVCIDGREVRVNTGTSVAAAVLNAGIAGFRHSVEGVPRGPVCGMGICFECRLTINGRAHQRSCMIVCEEGMVIDTDV